MNRWRVFQCVAIALFIGAGCAASSQEMRQDSYAHSGVESERVGRGSTRPAATVSVDAESAPSDTNWFSFSDSNSGGATTPAAPAKKAEPKPAPQASTPAKPDPGSGAPSSGAGGGKAATSKAAPKNAKPAKSAPLLIYNGTVLLALYDVADTQQKILKLVESEGGWVSTRSTKKLILRVPAPKFRDMLDQLSEMGDLLDLKWQAEDVTAVVRDTRIRLDSALAMRQRLQELLVKAENVKDALAIEEQLGRVILEIEQLQATLRGYKERIAYSTITVEFRAKTDRELPTNEYSLPFYWLQGLGVNRLLQIPGR